MHALNSMQYSQKYSQDHYQNHLITQQNNDTLLIIIAIHDYHINLIIRVIYFIIV